jgi:hypothetical protein
MTAYHLRSFRTFLFALAFLESIWLVFDRVVLWLLCKPISPDPANLSLVAQPQWLAADLIFG